MKSRKKERRDDDCVVGSEALTKGARLTGLGEPAGNLERPQCILGPLGCLAPVPVTWRSPPVRCRNVHDCAVTQTDKLGSGSPTGRQALNLC